MIVQIAFGIFLGFLFIGLFVIIIVAFCMLINRLQEQDGDEIEEIIRPRIRPERTRYEETQELKQRASENRPDHWRQK